MKVMEIFKTLQGEGLYSGCPTTFIRFAGCSLGCHGCDTIPSWKSENKIGGVPECSPELIRDEVRKLDIQYQNICITGGEPLEQKTRDIVHLVQLLLTSVSPCPKIVIETGGHVSIKPVQDALSADLGRRQHICWSVDYKTPGTGKHERMIRGNFLNLTYQDVVKMVCYTPDDFLYCLEFLRFLEGQGIQTNCLFHSVGGKADRWLPCLIMDQDWRWMKNLRVRYGVQIHKLVDMR